MNANLQPAPDRLPSALLTPEEAAAFFSVPVSWVYRAAREGTIPSVRLGRYVRFRRPDIEAYAKADDAA